MSGKTSTDYEDDYTEPELRERLKDEIKRGDKGGRPGQWSARKSQLLVSEYEKHGGAYLHSGRRTESQQHLSEWTDQDWHTADGSADAIGGAATERYLPDGAWTLLSADERAATEKSKRHGRSQHVPNTDAARHAKAAAELVALTAREAVKRVAAIDSPDTLDRAQQAETELGRSRNTVLAAIERRRAWLG